MTTSYRVKVLPTKPDDTRTALFGGAGICKPLISSLTLLVQLEKSGSSITLYMKSLEDGGYDRIGTLEPGETFALVLDQVLCVTAEAVEDTHVQCTILTPSAPIVLGG